MCGLGASAEARQMMSESARAMTASRGRRRTPRGRARDGFPCSPAARRTRACCPARRSCPPTGPARRRAAGSHARAASRDGRRRSARRSPSGCGSRRPSPRSPHAVPVRGVIAPRHAQREGEEVGAAQREVRRVVGAHAAAGDHDLLRAGEVGVDGRHHAIDDPRLVGVVGARPVLQGDRAVRPRCAVVGVHAVELDAGPPRSGRRPHRSSRRPRGPTRDRARPGRAAAGGRSARSR